MTDEITTKLDETIQDLTIRAALAYGDPFKLILKSKLTLIKNLNEYVKKCDKKVPEFDRKIGFSSNAKPLTQRQLDKLVKEVNNALYGI